MRNGTTLILLLLVASTLGCLRETAVERLADAEDRNDLISSNANAGPGEIDFRPAILPTAAEGDCDTVPVLSVCEWANSVDAIVVGTVEARQIIDSPFWIREDGNPRLEPECPSSQVSFGFAFDLAVTSVLYGTAPNDMTVSVGAETLKYLWNEWPAVDDTGDFYWSNVDGEGPFEVGTTVGIALMKDRVSHNWVVLKERPFTFTSNGALVFSEPTCSWTPPEPQPFDYWKLDDALRACVEKPNAAHVEKAAWFTTGAADISYAASCDVYPTATNNVPYNPDAGTGDAGP